MKNLRHIFLVVQIVGVLASHPLDHRSLPAVEIPFCGSTSAYVDVICAATDSSCVFESAAPSLLNSATACPFHEPRSTTSVTSSRLIVDGLKAHATCHPASGHGCTDRMKNLRHIFLVVQIVGVLASHPLDHRSLPAVEIPFCGSTSAYVDVICAATDSSCVFESAAPSLLNSATACPFHEPRSTTCLEQIKSSAYAYIANDLEISKAVAYLRKREFSQACKFYYHWWSFLAYVWTTKTTGLFYCIRVKLGA
ncbi:hypothetical protein MRX96_007180 [Rhipicephalus microplus]